MQNILVRGDGIAARCACRLLARNRFQVSITAANSRPLLPAIMVSESTQRIFADVFENPDLLRGMPVIRSRVVAWGDLAAPLALPHSAIVVSEPLLLSRLEAWPRSTLDADWTVHSQEAAISEGTPVQHFSFGSRRAHVSRVELDPSCAQTCMIESLAEGWLFLLADGEQTGWLISGAVPIAQGLAESRLIASKVNALIGAETGFRAHPRITLPLTGERWLACGSAALGFDPLCGDGSGYALREGILAVAVINAAARDEPIDALHAHYEHRMIAGLSRHLQACLELYSNGGSGVWWKEQVEETQEGLRWCRQYLGTYAAYRYGLRDFELIRLAENAS